MCRPNNQLKKLSELKRQSRKCRSFSHNGRSSIVLEEKGRLREYLAFRDGELEIYDVTGRAKNQISLTREEFAIVVEMEKRGIKALKVEQ